MYWELCLDNACFIIQLHQPREDGLDEFWVDFNIATNNMSLYTEDVCTPGPEGGAQGNDNDDMWESIIVKNDIVKEWSVTSEYHSVAEQSTHADWPVLTVHN